MDLEMHAEDFFANELAACDYNGDGHDDLAIGIPNDDTTSWEDHGSLVVVYGKDNGIIPSTAVQFTQGLNGLQDTREDEDYFGGRLIGGNFNGDPYCDLAVGVPFEDIGSPAVENAGIVQILFGSISGITTSGNQLFYQGFSSIQDSPDEGDKFGDALATMPIFSEWILIPFVKN
jgi:hypothetical protein